MKFSKKIILTLTILLSTFSFSQTNSKIVGEWIGKDTTGSEGEFIFTEDYYASMAVDGEFIDGKNYVIKEGKNNGRVGILKYTVDYSKSPITIDYIAMLIENNKQIEKGRILGIIKFISDNEMLLILNYNGKRDEDFNEENKEEIITLVKKQLF